MVDLGANPDWPGSLTLPAILAPRGRRDQEGKALRVSADLNPGHIKKKKIKQVKLILIIYFIWPSVSNIPFQYGVDIKVIKKTFYIYFSYSSTPMTLNTMA